MKNFETQSPDNFNGYPHKKKKEVTGTSNKLTKTSIPEDEVEIIRDPIFTNYDQPFGIIEQHTFNILVLSVSHVLCFWYMWECHVGRAPYSTLIFEILYGYFSGLGITVGAHRYWTHKSFKAKPPLQWILMIAFTITQQFHLHKWVLDHRLHHKYTDTNADPHNSKRGFWFSHIGWLLQPKHPELQKKLKTFDMSDLENDPVVRFGSKHYLILSVIFSYLIPIAIVWWIWRIPLIYCFGSNARRLIWIFHITYTVNSVAHFWGDRPYDKSITATDNLSVSLITGGEGFHNYHHTYPWDYRASEFGWKINLSTELIYFFVWIGWAYDLKSAPNDLIKQRQTRTGDASSSSHYFNYSSVLLLLVVSLALTIYANYLYLQLQN